VFAFFGVFFAEATRSLANIFLASYDVCIAKNIQEVILLRLHHCVVFIKKEDRLRILHLSDFHISEHMDMHSINTKIDKLLECIKQNIGKIDAIFFTGDAIDQNYIKTKIENELVETDTQRKLQERLMHDGFDSAKKILKKIQSELLVESKDIVICCGNHDILLPLKLSDHNDCENNDEIDSSNSFSLFNQFCENINGRIDTYKAHLVLVKGIPVVVTNTTWDNKKANGRRCILCQALCKVIEESRKKYESDQFVILAHSPKDDICEQAKYSYDGKSPVLDADSLWLCGDKHTNFTDSNNSIVGAPINADNITYAIYNYDETNYKITNRYEISYTNGIWHKCISEKILSEVYDFSKEYLKATVWKMIRSSNAAPELKEIMAWFSDKKNDKIRDNWNKLFCLIAKETKQGVIQSSKEMKTNDIFFERILDSVNTSETNYSLAMRGERKLGKSLMANFIFFYMLYYARRGLFNFIPIYINIDNLSVRGSKESDITHTEIENENLDKIQKTFDLAKKIRDSDDRCFFCYIIDGLSQYDYYDSNSKLETYVRDKIRSDVSSDKYVVVIDTDQNLSQLFQQTPIGEYRNAKKVIYFDPINLIEVFKNTDDTIDNFLDLYCNLFQVDYNSQKETIIENIKSLNLSSIDLGFLHLFVEKLNEKCNLSKLYQEDFEKKVKKHEDRIKLYKFAYQFYFTNCKKYSEFENEITELDYELILNEKQLSYYLIAKHYLDSLKTFDTKDANAGVLENLFNKDISQFITDIIKSNNLQREISTSYQGLYKQLGYKGKAYLTYILGRVQDPQMIKRDYDKFISNAVQIENLKLKQKKVDEDNIIFYKVLIRTLEISKIAINDDRTLTMKYLISLIKDSNKREINRSFHKLFYGDISFEDFVNDDGKDKIREGLDFYKTFHRLAIHLQESKNNQKDYTLALLELFSLCNIVQVRIQHKKTDIKNSRDDIVPSIFYNDRYKKNICETLNKLMKFIDYYVLDNELFSNCKNEVYYYFTMIKYEMIKVLKFWEDEKNTENTHINKFFFHPSDVIKDVERLYSIDRIGWKIKDHKEKITKEDIKKYQAGSSHEKNLEHIFSMYLIGLFFLPDDNCDKMADKNPEKYSKQTVLNMVLLHDLGESETGDYPPNYEGIKDIKDKEDEYNRITLLKSTFDGMADLSDSYNLWDQWEKYTIDKGTETNINIRIAKDLDKIQMYYKFRLIERDLNFNEKRSEFFVGRSSDFSTDIGKKIFSQLMDETPNFKHITQ
jgi:5'-deoxynucleotidase YfbR-like HD superfamily hydrolase/predicted MPP superfamily phosphohydrolase